MYHKLVREINESLKKTKKAIIALGCSFVEGQGAVDQYLYDDYEWQLKVVGVPMEPVFSREERSKILTKHRELISYSKDGYDWTFMEYKNSFVNVLCKKYFEGQYTPINFGLRGRGNRASIKSLYFWPQIEWKTIEEMIVIYVPSSPERFDFVNDEFYENRQFQCIWPNWKDINEDPRRSLWKGYGEAVYSNKSALLEQISNIVELKTWCEYNRAKLVITPAFDKIYSRNNMLDGLKEIVLRDDNQKVRVYFPGNSKNIEKVREKHHYNSEYFETLEKLVDMWPWETMFQPESCETFIDLCLKQEGLNKPNDPGFWDYRGVGTKNNWITVCCHPSAKGHDLFAMRLQEHISKL